MIKVVLESPYAGDIERNVKYARECMADCLKRGEAPIASHLLYTQEGILDDSKPEERKLGIEAGLLWATEAEKAIFYVDCGISRGMLFAKAFYDEMDMPYETRKLYAD